MWLAAMEQVSVAATVNKKNNKKKNNIIMSVCKSVNLQFNHHLQLSEQPNLFQEQKHHYP